MSRTWDDNTYVRIFHMYVKHELKKSGKMKSWNIWRIEDTRTWDTNIHVRELYKTRRRFHSKVCWFKFHADRDEQLKQRSKGVKSRTWEKCHVREWDLKYVRKEIQVREMLRMRNRSYWMVQTSTSRTRGISDVRKLGICYDQRTWRFMSRTCAGIQSKTRT